MNQPEAIVVLGMHRSGTSVIARLLNLAGVNLGRELFQAQVGVNEKGFWENNAVVDINDDILLSAGSSWDDWFALPDKPGSEESYNYFLAQASHFIHSEFGKSPLWGIKDPRLCRLLPLWKEAILPVVSKLVFVLPVRHPAEVVDSLVRRDGFSQEKALLLWLRHVLEAERGTRNAPRIFCLFDDVLEDPASLYDQVDTTLLGSVPVAKRNYVDAAMEFINVDLRHHAKSRFDVKSPLVVMANEAYALLKQAATSDSLDLSPKFDAVWLNFQAWQEDCNPVLIEQIRSANYERGKYQLIWRRIARLTTWKMTRPLRYIEKKLRGY